MGPTTSQGSRSNSSSLDRSSIKSGTGSASGDRPTPPPHVNNLNKPPPPHSQGSSSSQGLGVNYRSLPVSSGIQNQHLSVVSTLTHAQALPDNNQNLPSQTEAAEVVVLTARPATVISNSSTSSPAPASDQRAAVGPDMCHSGRTHTPEHTVQPSGRERCVPPTILFLYNHTLCSHSFPKYSFPMLVIICSTNQLHSLINCTFITIFTHYSYISTIVSAHCLIMSPVSHLYYHSSLPPL